MEVDLSEFINEAPKGKPPRKVAPISKPTAEPRPLHHVVCTQCGGSGKFLHMETLTPMITEEQERIYDRFEKSLPRQIVKREEVKCSKCLGAGHHSIPDDVRHMEIVLIWTRSECSCGCVYEGPAHVNSVMVRSDVYCAMVHLGVQKGWRYLESVYVPRELTGDLRRLPMRIETTNYRIDACRKCIHEKVIICLPHEKEQLA